VKKKRTSNASAAPSTTAPRRRGRIVRYLIVAVGCVLIIDALVGDRGLLAIVKARQQYRSLESSLVRSRAENAQLREQARQLREDPQAIEDIARRELGLIRPGEKLFIIKDVK
jgi:cell division protein FtsB